MIASTRRRLSVSVVAAACLVLPVVSSFGAVECPQKIKDRPDGWKQIAAPAFSYGGEDIVDYTVIPFAPKTIFVTNGAVVMRTTNGGCTWDQVYDGSLVVEAAVAEASVGTVALTITSLQTTNSVDFPVVYASGVIGDPRSVIDTDLLGPGGPDLQPIVAVSTSLGARWQTSTITGAEGRVRSLQVSADSSTAYVLAGQSVTTTDGRPVGLGDIFRTEDAGATWARVAPAAPTGFLDFRIDALDARVIWAWDEESFFHSTDRGVTWREVRDVSGPIGDVITHHMPPDEPSVVHAFPRASSTAYRSQDGGRTFKRVDVKLPVLTAVAAFLPGVPVQAYAVAAPGLAVVRFGTTELAAPIGNETLRRLRWGITDTRAYYSPLGWGVFGMTTRNLFLRTWEPVKRPPLPPVNINLRGGRQAVIEKAQLLPQGVRVSLMPGQSKVVQYELELPPTPTPMDIFFETDATGSMDDVIGGLRQDFQDIVDDLADSGIDVWFGVGAFRDYDHPTGSPNDFPYLRLRKVGPVDEELKDAIEAIETGGGNGLDSGLAASWAAATGLGQLKVNGVPAAGYHIKPGEGAEWRQNSLRVIVNAADVRSRDPERDPGYPGPSYEKVIRALNRNGVKQVGLAVGSQGDSVEGPRYTLERVSEGTETVAPPEGTDCDDDGQIDLDAGTPLVCTLPPGRAGSTAVAPAIVGLLRSITDLGPVSLSLTGDLAVVRHTSDAILDGVNLKVANRLRYDVQFRCDPQRAGQSFQVGVQAAARERVVARTTATVDCLPPEPAPAFLLPLIAAPIVAVQPPAPVPQPNTNPNPNPNPQPQPQPHPNMAMAQQDQQQAELALAYNDNALEEEDLAMVALEPTWYGPATTAAAMAMASVAGAFGLHRRRLRLARQSVRDTPPKR